MTGVAFRGVFLEVSEGQTSESVAQMPARKLRLVRLCLLAYVLLTFWQVAGHREDWPLSGFPMFSGTRVWGQSAQRTTLVGVTDQGERTLPSAALSSLMSPARLRQIFEHVRTSTPEAQARFTDKVASLLGSEHAGAQLFGLRFYKEAWQVRPGLKGIEHPKRRLEFAEFLPPASLLAELRAGGGKEPQRLPPGDWLAEPDAGACRSGCVVVSDAGASAGKAVRLTPGEGAAGTLELEIPSGAARLFVRMRTQAAAGQDVLTVTLDGETPKTVGPAGIGNYKADLRYDGWVWASVAPGWPPLELAATDAEPRTLLLGAELGVVELDQVWLATTRLEIPLFTAPVERAP